MNGTVRRRVTNAVVLSLAPLLVAAGCARNPATGRRELALVSEAQELALGRESAQEVSRTLGLVDDRELQSYVSDIGRRLALDSERPELPWEFHVVDDPVPNAFALPGGFIYVTRGMLNLMSSEAQLASVLGHEIGHVTARHSVSQISKQQLAQLGLGLGSILVPDAAPFQGLIGSGLGLLFLKYSRDDEREADELGFRYISEHRYDRREFAEVFRSLERSASKEEGAMPNWMSTHPAPAERVKTAEERLAQAPAPPSGPGEGGAPRVARDVYLRQIDDLVYGSDPRDGFFRDGTFYHPRLRFQITFPRGWQAANLTQAVVAAAPENRAMLQLTVAGRGGDPEQALRQFYSSNGIQTGQAARATVNGRRAAIGEFQGQTEQGVVAGLVGFIAHGDETYQVVGYTSADQYGRFARTFEEVIRGFGPVTNPRIIDVSPQRIDIVQVPRAMTVSEFARQFDSAVPADRLALLNQVPSAESRLEPGLAKRVIGPRLPEQTAAR